MEGSSPSNYQAQVKCLEGELKKAKQQQQQQQQQGSILWDVDNECEAPSDQDRLAAIEVERCTIASLDGPTWSKLKGDLRAERQVLEQQLLDAQPVATRLRNLLHTVDQAERQLVKGKKHLETCRGRLVAAEQAAEEANLRVKENEQLLGRLKAQQAALAAQGVVLATAAPSQGGSAVVPILQLDSEKVRQLLAQGLDELGVQVPDLSQFAVQLCEWVPQCSQQSLVRLDAPVGQALAGAAATASAGPALPATAAPGPSLEQMRAEIAAGGVSAPEGQASLAFSPKTMTSLPMIIVAFYFILLSDWQRLDLSGIFDDAPVDVGLAPPGAA
ncbi:unnamed protein product, partial [Prorocentrum cordatum]